MLLASKEGHYVPNSGFCKSIDAEAVDTMRRQQGYVLNYIEEVDSIYEINPEMVVYVMSTQENNIRFPPTDGNRCPLCGETVPLEGSCCSVCSDARYEMFRHRLKYYDVPFRAINAININIARTRSFSHAESWLDSKFKEERLPLLFIGNSTDPIIKQNYGWVPDWISGSVAVEYDGSMRSSASKRYALAKEHGVKLVIIQISVREMQKDPKKLKKEIAKIKVALGVIKQTNLFTSFSN